jgi:hypothetical protein
MVGMPVIGAEYVMVLDMAVWDFMAVNGPVGISGTIRLCQL